MLFRTKKPEFYEIDGEYVVPVRFSESATHDMLGGWYPMGMGWGHLRPRPDGSFDLFVKQADVSDDLNLVRLDKVSQALMCALDLAMAIEADEEASEDAVAAARYLKQYVEIASK